MEPNASGDTLIYRLLLAPWRTEAGAIRTRLSTAQCRERLANAADPWWQLFGGRPVFGRIGGAGGMLRKRIWYDNSFQTVLRYRLESSGAGTRIEYRAGLSHYARVFSLVWLGFVALMGIGGTAVAASTPGGWIIPAGALLMVGFMIVLVGFGRWLARGEARYLIGVLTGAVEGQPSNY